MAVSKTWWIVGAAALPIFGLAWVCLVLGGVVLHQQRVIRAQRDQLRAAPSVAVGLPAVAPGIHMSVRPSPRPAPATPPFRLQCRYCDANGYLMEGTGHELDKSRYGCPVCHGEGVRMKRVPDGKTLCAECKGWGLLGHLRHHGLSGRERLAARLCKRCSGEGFY